MMNIGIVGSRTFNDYELLATALLDWLRLDGITCIVSGGARGADQLAENFAENIGFGCTVIKPDWDKYGKAAGMIRNTEIVKQSDMIVAFWDGKSRGTKDTIEKAKSTKKPTLIVYF